MARLHHRRQATGRDHCADSGRLLTGESGETNSNMVAESEMMYGLASVE